MATESAILITACDAKYFELARELIESIDRVCVGRTFDLGILDLGLKADQRAWLDASRVSIVRPGWDIPGIELGSDENWYKAMTARPFLPQYFKQHELLMWLDADSWVQRADAVDLFFMAASKYGFAIVPELHRSYHVHYGDESTMAMHRQSYQQAFGENGANQLMQFPILNSGAFAARRDNKTWQMWAGFCQQAMARGPTKHSEQAALNAALYSQSGPRFHPLPAWCNWICPLANPLWDSIHRRFVEPVLPHEVIGIMHLCYSDYHGPTPVESLAGSASVVGFRRKFVQEFL